jgi:hypothetical protein
MRSAAMNTFELYTHHGRSVWVNKTLKGKHQEHCLCFSCGKFFPNDNDNCRIAEMNFAMCKAFNLVTPVYECPEFADKDG